MKKKCCLLALSLMLSFPIAFTSCGDDEPDKGGIVVPGDPDDPDDPDAPDDPDNDDPDQPVDIDPQGDMYINGQNVSDAKIKVFKGNSFGYAGFRFDSTLYGFDFKVSGPKLSESSVGQDVSEEIDVLRFLPVSVATNATYYSEKIRGSVKVKAVSSDWITLEFNNYTFSYWRMNAEDEAETYSVTGTTTFQRSGM